MLRFSVRTIVVVLTLVGGSGAWAQEGAQPSFSIPPPPTGAAPATAAPAGAAMAVAPEAPLLAPPAEPQFFVFPVYAENRWGGLYFHADYLYLKAHRQALDYAILDHTLNDVVEGPVQSLEFDARSGLRTGLGYRLPGEGWEIAGQYTYFHTADTRSSATPAGGSLLATRTRPGLVSDVAAATASTNLDYDVFDVELGRTFRFGESLQLRLAGGGRFAVIDQRFVARYNGIDASMAHVANPIFMDGAGLRMGGEGQWILGRGFRLYGRAAASLVAADIETNLTEFNNAGATPVTRINDKYESIIPVGELGLGIGWYGEHLFFSVGYEVTNWFHLIDTPDLVDDFHKGKIARRQSDLSLDGLSFRLGLTF